MILHLRVDKAGDLALVHAEDLACVILGEMFPEMPDRLRGEIVKLSMKPRCFAVLSPWSRCPKIRITTRGAEVQVLHRPPWNSSKILALTFAHLIVFRRELGQVRLFPPIRNGKETRD
jgi:hypothetical protein